MRSQCAYMFCKRAPARTYYLVLWRVRAFAGELDSPETWLPWLDQSWIWTIAMVMNMGRSVAAGRWWFPIILQWWSAGACMICTEKNRLPTVIGNLWEANYRRGTAHRDWRFQIWVDTEPHLSVSYISRIRFSFTSQISYYNNPHERDELKEVWAITSPGQGIIEMRE